MKFGTLRDGGRDGRLVVVSRDVTQASDARHLAPTLQRALDDWDAVSPALLLIARGVEAGAQPVGRFHEREAMAPLPRAYQWIEDDGGAPRWRVSEGFAMPRSGMTAGEVAAGVAVILGDVALGAGPAEAAAAIRLVTLVQTSADGGAAFSPVAVTPDELGVGWDGSRLSTPPAVEVNGRPVEVGASVTDFVALIVQAARERALPAGTVVGSRAIGRWLLGPGDRCRVELRDGAGHSILGAIERAVETANVAAA